MTAILVRNQEMWQSLSIIEQAYQKVQEFKGAEAEVYHADVPEYYLPPKEDVYTKMEALIWHFKIIMGEIRYAGRRSIPSQWKEEMVN